MKLDVFKGGELRQRIWRFRNEFVRVGVLSFVANILMLAPTLYLLNLYDRVLTSRNEITLIVLTIVLLAFFVVMAFAERLRSQLLVRTGVRLDEDLNSPVFNASFEAFLKRAGGNNASAFTDLISVRQFLTGNGILAFFDAPWSPIFILVIFFMHPLLGVLAVFFAGIQLLVTYHNYRSAFSDIESAARASRESAGYVEGKLRNIEPLHAMGMAGNIRDRWLRYHETSLAKNEVALSKQNRQQSFAKFIRYTMQSLTLGAAAMLVIHGALTPGAMIATSVLMARALQPFDLVVSTWQQFIQARMAFQRLEKLLNDYPERGEGSIYPVPKGKIELDALVATAENRKTPIIQELTAEIPAGKVVAMIGPSGSGKSTLARCMLGVWPDKKGKVLLDGQPLENWDRMELGPYIGYLPQDIELFDGTIAENIARFGKIDADKVIEAAKRTGIHEIVLRFPKGYDADIGVAGNMLSAGQRQRIALARALYGNPPLVVLDEPNANLDDAGDRALVQAIHELKREGSTVILISHRLNILGVADLLMVLRDGTIVHYGNRDTVLAAMHAPVAPNVVSVV